MQLGKDIFNFIKTLTLVDYVFFFAVIMLLVLVITLIYFIKLNKDSLIVEDEEDSSNDLLEITRELEKVEEKPRIEFTDYEKDQEEKAIISYDELVKKGRVASISYDDEKDLDGLSVKKVNLENNSLDDDKKISENIESVCRVISYKQEEDFLVALKQLNNILN